MPLHSKKRKASGSEDGHSHKTKKSQRSQMKIGEMFSPNLRQMHSSKPQSEPFSFKKCLRWFKEYAENDQIEPEGMERLCKAIDVQPDDIVMLVLAQKLNAQNMGFFTLEEWTKGMQSLQCDTTAKLQGKISSLRMSLDDPTQFKIIYRYAFDFAKEAGQRTLDIETAKAMLDLLMSNKWSLYPQFQSYMNDSKCKAINRDQWNNILEFSKSILPDISNYDMDGAWPVLMDEFVEFMKKHQTKSA